MAKSEISSARQIDHSWEWMHQVSVSGDPLTPKSRNRSWRLGLRVRRAHAVTSPTFPFGDHYSSLPTVVSCFLFLQYSGKFLTTRMKMIDHFFVSLWPLKTTAYSKRDNRKESWSPSCSLTNNLNFRKLKWFLKGRKDFEVPSNFSFSCLVYCLSNTGLLHWS